MSARSAVFVACVAFGAGGAMAADSPAPEAPTSEPTIRWSIKLGGGAEVEPKRLVDERPRPSPASLRVSFDFSMTMEFSLGANSGGAAKPAAPADGPLTEVERELIELTNKERMKAKLPPLKADPALMKLAREHNARMERLNQLGHELEDETFSKRMKASGYQALAAGENCAEGARTPAEAVADWMTSPGHKANILNDKFTQIGVAQGKSKEGKTFSTQVFAKPFETQSPPAHAR